jgi:hypothetical protein
VCVWVRARACVRACVCVCVVFMCARVCEGMTTKGGASRQTSGVCRRKHGARMESCATRLPCAHVLAAGPPSRPPGRRPNTHLRSTPAPSQPLPRATPIPPTPRPPSPKTPRAAARRPARLVHGGQPLVRDLADVQQPDGAADVDKRAIGPHALHHAHHHVADLKGGQNRRRRARRGRQRKRHGSVAPRAAAWSRMQRRGRPLDPLSARRRLPPSLAPSLPPP